MLGADRAPQSAESVDAMRFGEAVFRESARLKSTTPIIFVESNTDTTVAGVHLPAGTRVVALTRQAGRPERVARFDPDRWLDPAENPTFLTFGAGPRFCPGRNLAFLEGKSAIGMLGRNFEIQPVGPPPREHFGFTMSPAGLRVRLLPRKVPASN